MPDICQALSRGSELALVEAVGANRKATTFDPDGNSVALLELRT